MIELKHFEDLSIGRYRVINYHGSYISNNRHNIITIRERGLYSGDLSDQRILDKLNAIELLLLPYKWPIKSTVLYTRHPNYQAIKEIICRDL